MVDIAQNVFASIVFSFQALYFQSSRLFNHVFLVLRSLNPNGDKFEDIALLESLK